MFDDLLRALKDRLLAPLALALGPRVPPTAVTMLAFVAGLGCAGAASRQAYGLALGLWAVNRFLDGLDGALARAHGRQTDFGGYLDLLLDFVVYAAVPAGLAFGRPTVPLLGACVLLLAAFYVNGASWMYLAALLEKRAAGAAARGARTAVTMPAGLVAGAETVVLYGLFLVFPGRAVELFGVTAGLVGVTVVQRVVWGRRILEGSAGSGRGAGT